MCVFFFFFFFFFGGGGGVEGGHSTNGIFSESDTNSSNTLGVKFHLKTTPSHAPE